MRVRGVRGCGYGGAGLWVHHSVASELLAMAEPHPNVCAFRTKRHLHTHAHKVPTQALETSAHSAPRDAYKKKSANNKTRRTTPHHHLRASQLPVCARSVRTRCSTEGYLEDGILDLAVLADLDLQLHHIAARRGAHQPCIMQVRLRHRHSLPPSHARTHARTHARMHHLAPPSSPGISLQGSRRDGEPATTRLTHATEMASGGGRGYSAHQRVSPGSGHERTGAHRGIVLVQRADVAGVLVVVNHFLRTRNHGRVEASGAPPANKPPVESRPGGRPAGREAGGCG